MHTVNDRIATVRALLNLADQAAGKLLDLPTDMTAQEIDALRFSISLHEQVLGQLGLGGKPNLVRVAALRSHANHHERALRCCRLAVNILTSVLKDSTLAPALRHAVNGCRFGAEVVGNELEAYLPHGSSLADRLSLLLTL